MSIVGAPAASSSLLRSMTWTAWSLKSLSVTGSPSRGGGPGSIGVASAGSTGSANPLTWPQCGPIACWTPLVKGMPFWLIMWAIWRGCQRLGSFIVAPGTATVSGWFTAL